jgi:hypothetical protein
MSLGDMSGPLCGKLDGITLSALVATNSAALTGKRPNKAPIDVSGVTDTRGFLSWVRPSCQSGLSAQIKGEKLMLVLRKADGFKATVSALRSFDGSKGLSFHTFSLPEDRCVRLLVKKLDRQMPEDVVREGLENLRICVQEVLQLRSGRRDQEASKARPLNPYFIVSVQRGPKWRNYVLWPNSAICESRWRSITPRKGLKCKRCQSFGHTQRYWRYAPQCVPCGEAYLSGECYTSQRQLKCCSCGGNHTAIYRGCVKWKEAKAALAKWTPVECCPWGGVLSGLLLQPFPTPLLAQSLKLLHGVKWQPPARKARLQSQGLKPR